MFVKHVPKANFGTVSKPLTVLQATINPLKSTRQHAPSASMESRVTPPNITTPHHNTAKMYFMLLFVFTLPSVLYCQTNINVGIIVDNKILSDGVSFFNRMAVNHNRATYSLVPYTDTSKGCGTGTNSADGAALAVELYYTHNISTFFGPVCSDDLAISSGLSLSWDVLQFNFWRDYHLDIDMSSIIQMSTMSATNIATNLAAVMQTLNWGKAGIIRCTECFDSVDILKSSFESIKRVLAERSVEILHDIDVSAAVVQSSTALTERLLEFTNNARIIFVFLGTRLSAHTEFMIAFNNVVAQNKHDYMPVIIIPQYTGEPIDAPWVGNQTIVNYFSNSIVLVNEYYNRTAIDVFTDQTLGRRGSPLSETLVYVQFYESIFVYEHYLSKAFNETNNASLALDALYLLGIMRNQRITGPFGEIPLDSYNQRIAPYSVYSITESGLSRFLTVEYSDSCPIGVQDVDGRCTSLVASFAEPNSAFVKELPPDTPSCGFNGELCDQKGTLVIVITVMSAVSLAVIIFLGARKIRSGETEQMPWAIFGNMIKFADDQFRGSSQDFQASVHSLQEGESGGGGKRGSISTPAIGSSKSDFRSHYHQRLIAMVEQVNVYIEAYQLREKIVFDKRDHQLLFHMKQAVHDNTNAFIGMSVDLSHETFIIWKHCNRGNLADIIFKPQKDTSSVIQENVTGAFVRDIIKGLDFLHSSPVGFHGSLTPYNCLIDSHWILKLSGFGMNRMLYRWRLSGMVTGPDGGPIIPDAQLHYFAPNIRAKISRAQASNKMSEIDIPNDEGRASDIYSFGVLLFEILFKKRAYDYIPPVNQAKPLYGEGLDGVEENEVGIVNEAAMEHLPIYPSVPDAPDQHPDLISLIHKCFDGNWQVRPDANMVRKITDATLKMPGSLVDQMIKNMEQYNNNLENLVRQRTSQLEEAQKKSEEILTELLPKSVADELKLGRMVPPKNYKKATIMYSDIVGFTSLCSESKPMEVVTLLSGVFKAFDNIIGEHQAYKVETIGDAYMVASGVPEKIDKRHVKEIAMIALKMRDYLSGYIIPHRPGQHLHCRWGFNTGSVFTGVVGVTAPRYCVFGQTVTLAAKMENSGQPDCIQMTMYSQAILSEFYPEFRHSKREKTIRLNGIGNFVTYWLEGVELGLTSHRMEEQAPP
uniref:guanylate cyclase n=1 Tax=Panagrellus redivivus TaxID=6233 RepID=A0A7E4VUI4_PANRE